ncbi:MAG TPA: protein kinase [Fimbriimonadaceae bacterium]|nr:protein kinase [Fimbriimonadaceae bacterium]
MSSPPTTLGKYQIIREIARSNDIVYEAYDPLMNRRVAIKELAVPSGSTPQQREERIRRFQREVKAAGSLAHPHIVTIYEVGEDAGRHFMAMEYLDGRTLRNELDTHGFLPIERSCEIAVAILEALDFAHKHGVIHRDIKPDNIQLLDNGQIKLTDFGIARLTFEPNLTMDGQVFGTPSYMSPEQVVGKDIDARSDLFGVGVVLYEMVAGHKPFAGDNVVSITFAITNKEPDPPPQASPGLWRTIKQALEKTPHLRWGSAKEMIQGIESAQRSDSAVGSAMMGAPPIYGTPYPSPPPGLPPVYSPDPYGSVPPVGPNPYAPPPPNPTPQTYTYNPYQLPPGGAAMPPAPIYYPKPPRGPLVKPETKVFLSRLVLTFLVLGSLIALILVAINAISTALSREQASRMAPPAQARDRSATRSITDRIEQLETELPAIQDQVTRSDAERRLAIWYEEQAFEHLRQGLREQAEAAFKRAIELDPTNPAFFSDLGKLYADAAVDSSLESQRLRLWLSAAENYTQASHLSLGENQSLFAQSAATCALNAATILQAANRRAEARELLTNVLRLLPGDSPFAANIRARLAELGVAGG